MLIRRIIAVIIVVMCIAFLYIKTSWDISKYDEQKIIELIKKKDLDSASKLLRYAEINDLKKLMNNYDPKISGLILDICGYMNGEFKYIDREKLVNLITEQLDSSEWRQRFFAIEALINLEGNRSIPALKMAWLRENNLIVIHQIYLNLIKLNGNSVINLFNNTYQKKILDKKGLYTLFALSELTEDRLYINDLLKVLDTGSEDIKFLLILEIGIYQHKKQFIPILEKALKDNKPEIRELAKKYLNEFRTKDKGSIGK